MVSIRLTGRIGIEFREMHILNEGRQSFFSRLTFGFALSLLMCSAARGEIRYDSAAQQWKLTSGTVEYRLQQKGDELSFCYFGAVRLKSWAPPISGIPRSDLSGQVEGQEIAPSTLKLISHTILAVKPGVDGLQLVFEHRRLPLRIHSAYITWGNTGVITRQITLESFGPNVLHIERLPSLAWDLPSGEYELTYLWGGWGQERQLAHQLLGPGARSFISTTGRSSNSYSPWFCLENRNQNTLYLAHLAYSGNWQMDFQRRPLTGHSPFWQNDLNVNLGMRFDFGGDLKLQPGSSSRFPEVAFTSSPLGLDEAANQFHRYQREFVVPHSTTNDPPLVQFNSWYPFPGKMNISDMKRCAEIAAQIGAEVFVLDAGWYNQTDWSAELGDYQADRKAFPHGIEELASHVRNLGMKFGMWVEIENVGVNSRVFHDHPDWCLQYEGHPIARGPRRQLNFARPDVRQWARSVIHRLVRNYGLEWLKIDYNIDIGEQFDPPESSKRSGDVLYKHLMSYYEWLDELRAAYPHLVIENCSSGGLRFDVGIMRHANTAWLSDEVTPKPSLQLAYGCTVEFTPTVCNHWMVGDTERGEVLASDSPGWWDFMFRVPMNGQFGFSSRVFDWTPELIERARQNISLYKALRATIANSDVFHLTPSPTHDDPTGWMAIQYVTPDADRSILMTYRLGQSSASQLFRLRSLDLKTRYRVKNDRGVQGIWTGRELTHAGIAVDLDAPWSADVIEIEAVH